MPHRAWRNTRDLAAALAILAIVQLIVTFVAIGAPPPWMFAAELALIVLLLAVALFAHLRRLAWLHAY